MSQAQKTPPARREGRRKSSAAERRRRTQLGHRWLRYGIQVAFFVLAPAVFSGAFSAVKYCFVQIAAGQPLEATAFVVLLLAVLGFTIVFGRFFCGYACAFGTIGDVLHDAFEFLRSKTPIPRIVFPEALVRALSLLKYLVLAGICLACFTGAWSAYAGYSPWVAFAAILSGTLDGVDVLAFVLLAAVAVGMVVWERFFCQFLCPLGALFSLMPVLGFSEFTRTRGHCARNCGKCHDACPVDIWPDADSVRHGECIECGRCADACPMANVNLVALERPAARDKRMSEQDASPRPVRKTHEGWRLFRGTHFAYTLARAVLLLGVLWIAGATRYLPPFADVLSQLPPLF